MLKMSSTRGAGYACTCLRSASGKLGLVLYLTPNSLQVCDGRGRVIFSRLYGGCMVVLKTSSHLRQDLRERAVVAGLDVREEVVDRLRVEPCARPLPQPQNSSSYENRTAAVRGARQEKAAVGPPREERDAPMLSVRQRSESVQ